VAKDVGKQAAAKKVRRWRLPVTVLCLLGGLFVGAVFLLAQSRSAYIGLVLTLLAFLMIVLPARWRWYSLIALVVLAALLGLLVASHWEMVHTWIGGSDQAANSELSLNSLEGRLEVWSSAIYGIQDFPFTGMGMNTFRKVVPVLYPLFTISPDIDIGHAHNEFLQAALDLGIPGLIAFLALYIGAFWMLWDIGKEVSDAKGQASSVGRSRLSFLDSLTLAKAIVLGLGGGLFAHLLYGLTDAVTLGAKPGVLFWMLLGLIAGLRRQAQEHWAVAESSVPTTGAENGLRE
jgi:putative inorganic carbon (HCO3(-)) transporter